MARKSKKHVKLDDEWVELVINVTMGPGLIVLAQKHPQYVELLYKKAKEVVHLVFEKMGREKTDEFTGQAIMAVSEVYEANIARLVQETLKNGIPKVKNKSTIIHPGNMRFN
jgi:hypothetical protein